MDILIAAERKVTSWADASAQASFKGVEKQLILWANPDLQGYTTPVHGWPMQSLISATSTAALYLGFVFVASIFMTTVYGSKPAADSKRKTTVLEKFQREPILILAALYNLVQVLLCAYMVRGALSEAHNKGYKFICNGFNKSESGMAKVLWVFYMSKVLDFMDTVFIIFRRKWRQLSFLHVYHHSSIFLIYWLNLNAGYDGDIYYTIALNSAIHFIMYGYYLLRTFNVSVPLIMKMLVTNMQLIQFVTMIGQAVYLRCFACDYPKQLVDLYFFYILTMIALFLNFRRRTYAAAAKTKTS